MIKELQQNCPRFPNKEDVYEFELKYYWRKEKKTLEVTLYSRLKIREEAISTVTTDNFTIFDKFAEYIGFTNTDKSVQFNAIIVDGEVIYNNDCDIYYRNIFHMG
ncbi:MAG: hypothetical protein NC936_06130 [Candidatus Omnitrophica bacterium]|nr:hypothetical protein [Candidatus Omnitrophota bacterium]